MNNPIVSVLGRQIFDSRGNPTVEAEVTLKDGSMGRASVPSGASTGSHEAIELRDGDSAYVGKGVLKAVGFINHEIQPLLLNKQPFDQLAIDNLMIDLDGTENKSRIGANAILAVSLAVAHAAALSNKIPLFQYISSISNNQSPLVLPMPMINILNGGQHALGSTDIQEYMIVPKASKSIVEALQIGSEIFHVLGKILRENGYSTTVGDEGGYAPNFKNGNHEPLEYIMQAIEKAGYKPDEEVSIAMDVAASELYKDNQYYLDTENRSLDNQNMIDWLSSLSSEFPIISIEDGLDENDWEAWGKLNETLGDRIQLVGDDLLVTNNDRLQQAVSMKSANAILIKPNQIGTLSETIKAVQTAQAAGWRTIMSHRSGETEDTTITHLAVGLSTGQIKTGSMSRSERIAKYNELLRIEEKYSLQLAHPF